MEVSGRKLMTLMKSYAKNNPQLTSTEDTTTKSGKLKNALQEVQLLLL